MRRIISIFYIATFAPAFAGTMGNIAASAGYQPVISLFGGYASLLNTSHSQTYLGTDDNHFVYSSSRNTQNTGLFGVMLGEEVSLNKINPSLRFQTGIEYTYFGNNRLSGSHTVGIEPETSTLYQYQYTLQSQQLMAIAKVLATSRQIYHPYLLVGIGAAFNNSSQFDVKTQEVGSINIAPLFANHQQTAFSYHLGLGLDLTVSAHMRMGIGYRLASLGHSSLGNGRVVFNNYSYPTGFGIHSATIYANQLIFQASYLI